MRSKTYVCRSCGRAKTLYAEPYESTVEFEEDLPDYVFCENPKCNGNAFP